MSDEIETLGLASIGALSSSVPVDEVNEAAQKSVCANCGQPVTEKFCEHCGQLNSDFHRPIWTLTKDVLSDAFSLDGRIARTLPKLMFAPGYVTRAYLEGKRARFVPPFRLFLLASLIFFFTLFAMGERVGWGKDLYVIPLQDGGYSVTLGTPDILGGDDAGNVSEMSAEEIRQLIIEASRIDTEMSEEQEAYLNIVVRVVEDQRELMSGIERWAPRLSFLVLPLMAMFLTLAYAWVRRVYVYDHVITSLHFQSFAYILGALIMIVGLLLGGGAAWGLLLLPAYLYRQLRVTYQSGKITSGIRAFVLFLLLVICLVLVSAGASVLGYLDLN